MEKENVIVACRAISETSGHLTYGFYLPIGDGYIVLPAIIHKIEGPAPQISSFHKVRRGTVGQITGFKDCDGVDIYTDDILASKFNDVLFNWLIERNEELGFVFVNIGVDGYLGTRFQCHESAFFDRKVIGNKHHNPELLSGGRKDFFYSPKHKSMRTVVVQAIAILLQSMEAEKITINDIDNQLKAGADGSYTVENEGGGEKLTITSTSNPEDLFIVDKDNLAELVLAGGY